MIQARTIAIALLFVLGAPAAAHAANEWVCKTDRVSSPTKGDVTIPRIRCRVARVQVETQDVIPTRTLSAQR